MPLSLPSREVSPDDFDQLLEQGYRRSGWFFYQTHCPKCSACEPLRLQASKFKPNRSQRRALKKGDACLTMHVGPGSIDQQRLRLFNAHRQQRDLDRGSPPTSASDYESFLLNSHGQVLELSFWLDDELMAISITDVGSQSFSAVYSFFDPAMSSFSPGTYAILKQIELAQRLGRKWLYLGMYVAANSHLNYKSLYLPHQRLIAGSWVDFARE